MTSETRKRPPIRSLIDKINSLKADDREVYAKRCGTSLGNLRQIAYGFGGVSPRLACLIIKHSDCEITIGQLIPDLISE